MASEQKVNVFNKDEVLAKDTLTKLPPDGHVDHTEHWFLNRVQLGNTEASLDKQLMPLVRKTGK